MHVEDFILSKQLFYLQCHNNFVYFNMTFMASYFKIFARFHSHVKTKEADLLALLKMYAQLRFILNLNNLLVASDAYS